MKKNEVMAAHCQPAAGCRAVQFIPSLVLRDKEGPEDLSKWVLLKLITLRLWENKNKQNPPAVVKYSMFINPGFLMSMSQQYNLCFSRNWIFCHSNHAFLQLTSLTSAHPMCTCLSLYNVPSNLLATHASGYTLHSLWTVRPVASPLSDYHT